MNKVDLIVEQSIIRIIGVFESSIPIKKLVSKLSADDYLSEVVTNENDIRNYWYPEFRDIYFLNKEDSSATILNKKINQILAFHVRTDRETNEKKYLNVTVKGSELFLFNGYLNFFSIDLCINERDLKSFSDLTFCARNFNTSVTSNENSSSWVNWIEKNILSGIKISSDSTGKKVKVDDYSGSKFKVYSVLDLEERLDPIVRAELLYDIGCIAPIGSAGGSTHLSPSNSYFEELLNSKISVFNNYDVLPLFDSFTVIGDDLLDSNPAFYKNIVWSQTYFRIYIHNLFIKFNLFRYNSEMGNDSVAVRDRFENFLNTYNLSHISYNFLPNLIYQKHRESLDIDTELEKFQDRINRISQAIQEQKQSRSNMLIGLIGLITSISSIEPILKGIDSFKSYTGMNSVLFYTLLSVIIFSVGIPILIFLFPEKTKQLKRKWRDRKNS